MKKAVEAKIGKIGVEENKRDRKETKREEVGERSLKRKK